MALRAAANVIYEPIFAVMLHVQIVFGDVNLPSSCVLADSRADSQNRCNLFIFFFSFFPPSGLQTPANHIMPETKRQFTLSSLLCVSLIPSVINSHTSLILLSGLNDTAIKLDINKHATEKPHFSR